MGVSDYLQRARECAEIADRVSRAAKAAAANTKVKSS